VQKPRATILVVEDNATMRDLLVDTLDAIGYRPTGASDGSEALQKLKEQKFPDGFLAKPFRISHIEELIEDTLKGKDVVGGGSQDVEPPHPI